MRYWNEILGLGKVLDLDEIPEEIVDLKAIFLCY